jgi:hypothetical protein
MGVALENARLFDETQHLLKETEQRNAELAVINSIQQGIAGSLSFQAIVELVGDKLREVLGIDTIGIRWYDHATRTAHFLYEIEHGTRVTMPVTASGALRSPRTEAYRPQHGGRVGREGGGHRMLADLHGEIVANDRAAASSSKAEREVCVRPARSGSADDRRQHGRRARTRLFDETQRPLKETEQQRRARDHPQHPAGDTSTPDSGPLSIWSATS